MEEHESLCISAFTKENLILTHYMLGVWLLHLRDGLGHYVIHQGVIVKIIIIDSYVMNLGYTYVICRIKNPPDMFCQITHTRQLIEWIP